MSTETPTPLVHRAGRPRRGTEIERSDALIQAATKVFLRDGYGLASIDKVASEAGVSTRTIYERFKNKADLLAAVITRLVDRDLATVFATAELDRLEPQEALTRFGRTLTHRMCEPEAVALCRIAAAEAQRFPELVAKLRCSGQARLEAALATYFRAQIAGGALALDDAERAAALFLQMVSAETRDCLLFGPADAIAKIDYTAHVKRVVDIFLFGAVPRTAGSNREMGHS